jgi:leucyl aminopeptidase
MENALEITAAGWKSWKGEKETLVLFAYQAEPLLILGLPSGDAGKKLQTLAKTDGFKGKERETLLVRPEGKLPAERALLIGLGKKANFDLEVLRRAVSKVLRGAEALGLESVFVRAPQIARSPAALLEEVQALSEGLLLGSYRFDRHKTPPKEAPKRAKKVTFLTDNVSAAWTKGVQRGRLFAQATALARDLINEPPSRMNPERLASEAKKVHSGSVSVKVYETKELEKLGMGGILGVGVGGAVPPRLVELVYKPSGKVKKTVALVGKGITFDSGGLSLKPAQSMETMKDDMSGAAAVLGVMSVLAELKFPIEVRGYLAIAENMPGGRAQKPGDVLKAFNGKTIEVLNTDAEGRLVLSDALAYACSKKPDVVIDVATLTGACVVALGNKISAIMTNTPALFRSLKQAGDQSGEKFWELPLEKEYKQDVKSKIADVQNIGRRRGEAGTIIGGLFLQEFVDERPWAHIDIAGPSWTDSDQPYCPTGATGHPVRTLLHYLESL